MTFMFGHTPWNKGLKGTTKVNSGCFRKGHIGWNKGKTYKHKNPRKRLPIGTERIKTGSKNYVYVKIAEPNTWMTKSRYVWEKHYNCKLKKSDVVLYLDADIYNFDIENLFVVTRAEIGLLTTKFGKLNNPEVNKAAIAWVKLKRKLAEANERNRKMQTKKNETQNPK